ncbi:MAG: sigma-70 family RNA polymerase sigma factor [Planctomycetota bacterium]
MLRFQSGDVTAYETLVTRHLEFVHRHARRYVGDFSEAEDVAQDVFLRLYRSAARFQEPVHFRGWLATMTTRIALNSLRTRKRKRWRHAPEDRASTTEWKPGAGPQPSDSPITGDEAALASERAALLHAAIARLPERQRTAIWLQRFESWSLEDIGAALDLGIPAVKSLLHRARAALAGFLEPYFETDGRVASTAVSPHSTPPEEGTPRP